MSGSLLVWAVLAVTMFWSVGVYNRLMRMRARGGSALGSVDKHMKQFSELVHAHLIALGAPQNAANADIGAAYSSTEWGQLLDCLTVLDSALKDVRGAPLLKQPLIRLSLAYAALQQAWSGLSNWAPNSAAPMVPDNMRSQWDAITAKVQTARGGLNQILFKYDEAIDQFPARLVAGVMRFEPAGQL